MATMEDQDSCPKIKSVDEDLMSLSYEDKLKEFQKEANSLYAFCLKKGFNNSEMLECVSKLYGPPKSASRRVVNDSAFSILLLSFLVGLAAVAYSSPAAQNLIAVHYKLASIKFILPLWNYGEMYNQECLIDNPWLPLPEAVEASEETCKFCKNLVKLNNNTIDRVKNIKPDDFVKYYIDNSQPVIVTDVKKDWESSLKSLDMNELSNLFQNNEFFTTFMGSCDYSTNCGFNTTFYDFITAYVDGTLPDIWHANWEICEVKAAKIIRKYYRRPYYLPEMAQAVTYNTIVAAKGKNDATRFSVNRDSSNGRWWTVISGELNIFLKPMLSDCMKKFGCKEVSVPLKAGESVFYSPDDWEFDYTVTSEGMTIAVMSSVIWDKY